MSRQHEKTIRLLSIVLVMRSCHFVTDFARAEWNALSRKIPVKYADGIGIDLDIMNTALEIDQREFDQVLQLPFFPKVAGVRMMPAVYATYEFPPDVREDEAIQILEEHSEKTGLYCFIPLEVVKTIFVQPDGRVFTDLYRPTIEIGRVWLNPSAGWDWIGRSFLG